MVHQKPNAVRCLGAKPAFTLTELIMVLFVLSLCLMIASVNVFGLLRKSTFKSQAHDLVTAMQMMANAAAESDRRYEIIIDLIEQRYTVRQITNPDLTLVLDEEIILQNYLSENCRVDYVLFDDMVHTDEEFTAAKFRVGHNGWQNGGKILLLDENGQEYSIMISPIGRIITLENGDVELLKPKTKDEVPF